MQVQNLEKEIVNILSDADPLELNYMLTKIGLGLLFYKVKDHVPMNMNRTRLLDLLAVTRVAVSHLTHYGYTQCVIIQYRCWFRCIRVEGGERARRHRQGSRSFMYAIVFFSQRPLCRQDHHRHQQLS